MTSVLNNIINNNIGGTTPADRNKWYYLALFVAIIVFFFLYVEINVSFNGKKQETKTEIPTPTTTRRSSTGDIFHTKITKMESSLEDQHKEMEQQFYS